MYMLHAPLLGITALVMAVPFAYDALRLAGAAYPCCIWRGRRFGLAGDRPSMSVSFRATRRAGCSRWAF